MIHVQKNNRYPNLILKSGIIKDQVYFSLKDAILDGRLAKGEKIPSSQTLAEMMSISRNSVLHGLSQLIDEGYLIAKSGSGTYVSNALPETLILAKQSNIQQQQKIKTAFDINPNKDKLMSLWNKCQPSNAKGKLFNIGIGCVDQFPHNIWRQLLNRAWKYSKKTAGNRGRS